MSTEPGLVPFPSTHWSQVGQAGADDTQRRQALGRLLERYLPAMRSYLIARFRFASDRADDLLQGFLADKVLEEDIVRHADRGRGRFRTFLVVALDRYTVSRLRRERAAKRMPEGGLAPLDEDALGSLAERPAPPAADPFDVAWAKQVVELAVRRMRQECDGGGRGDVWEVFESRVLLPATGEAPPRPVAEVTRRLGVTPARVSNLLVTSKRMFARNLRAAVCEKVRGGRDADEELRRLRAILSAEG